MIGLKKFYIKISFLAVLIILLLGSSVFLYKTDSKQIIAQAASSVTLSASGYSDPDAEDNHTASQWVVRDNDSTIFDSAEDATNLTSITLSGSLFTEGVTYFWKVRYKDEHNVWSAYSDESSFVYLGGDVTPTPAPSSTTTATETVTATSSATTTATATVSTTTTILPDVTVTSSPVCNTDYCSQDIEIINASADCENQSGVIVFKIFNATISPYQGKVLTEKIPNLIIDIYLSFSSNENYFYRVANDYNYLNSYQWVKDPGYSWSYLQITADFEIPQDLLGACQTSTDGSALVHTYPDLGDSWGDSVSLIVDWVPFANPSEMADKIDDIALNPAVVIDDEVISKPCLMEIVSPKNNDEWSVGSMQDIIWNTDREYKDVIERVNIALSKDGGKSVSDPLLIRGNNSGFFSVRVLDRYASNKAVLQFVGLDRNGEPVSYCESDRFRIKGTLIGGLGGSAGKNVASAVLLLGALASSVPLWILLVSRIPALARLLSRLGLLFMPPGWPKDKPAWGVVYDSISKKPISRVVMRIYSEPDGKQKDVQTSNERGEFGFLVPRGEYSITASAPGYNFPTHIIGSDRDGKYYNLYKGGKITISASSKGEKIEKAPILINIPMDPSRASTFDIAVVGFLSAVHKFTTTIRIPVMVVGTLATIYLSIKYSRLIDWIVLGIYIVLWIFEIRDLFKKKAYGIIIDEHGHPVSLAIVRVMNKSGKIVKTSISGDDGKFFVSIDPGIYRFDIVKPGYRSIRSKPIEISKIQDIRRVKMRIEKISKSESSVQYKTNISS